MATAKKTTARKTTPAPAPAEAPQPAVVPAEPAPDADTTPGFAALAAQLGADTRAAAADTRTALDDITRRYGALIAADTGEHPAAAHALRRLAGAAADFTDALRRFEGVAADLAATAQS